MRKALFAIVVVAASFAGGAVVNGPGSRWSKALLQFINRSDDDETATEDLARVEEPGPSATATVPASPLPPLSVEPAEPAAKDAKGNQEKSKPEAKSASPAPGKPKPVPEPKAPEPLEPKPLEPLDPLPLEPAEPIRTGAGQDANRTKPRTAPEKTNAGRSELAAIEPLSPLEPPEPFPKADDAGGKSIGEGRKEGGSAQTGSYGDAPGSAPATAVPPRGFSAASRADEGRDPAVTQAGAPADTGKSAAGDWAAIRRKMAELGVTRFGVDGELGGPVRFHCVIPLAGRRAVGQQFEAEGDDVIEAAQAALRRVALWRATEETP